MYLLAHDYGPQAQQAFVKAIEYLPLDARWHYLSGYVDHLDGDDKRAIAKNLARQKNGLKKPGRTRLLWPLPW